MKQSKEPFNPAPAAYALVVSLLALCCLAGAGAWWYYAVLP
jgi:hypothetical protein